MKQIRPNVFAVGAIDWDRRLFDELIPLPEGTTYNSYVVNGSEKVALLDTVDPTKSETLLANLVSLELDKVDYIVSHHAEQDHSGTIPEILMLYPGAKIVTNAKCRSMLIDLLHLEEDRFLVVEDNQTLSLGDKTLRFINTPWVHWPETMGTYLEEDKVYFSCDFFGAHLAESSLFVASEPLVYEAAKLYFSEIMMPFRTVIRKNIEKIDALDIDVIAPSHGPVYDNPRFIIDAYKDWISDDVKNEVVLAYVSMHESTQKMAEHLTDALVERGILVRPFNLAVADLGKVAMALVDAATVVLGSPTVLTGAHPKVAYAALVVNALRPKTRFASIFGSYGWASKMVEQLSGLLSNLKVDIIPPVVSQGQPKDDAFLALDQLADEILNRHRAIRVAQ